MSSPIKVVLRTALIAALHSVEFQRHSNLTATSTSSRNGPLVKHPASTPPLEKGRLGGIAFVYFQLGLFLRFHKTPSQPPFAKGGACYFFANVRCFCSSCFDFNPQRYKPAA